MQTIRVKNGPSRSGVVVKNSDAYEAYLLKCKQIVMCCRRPCAPDRIISVVSEFVFEVPVSWTLKKQEEHWGKPARQRNHGDSDNLQKPVCDVLQEMGWLVDDAQVGAMLGVKRFQKNRDEKPCTIITLLATT